MKRSFVIDLSTQGIDELKRGLVEYQKWLSQKTDELCRRLAEMGAEKATMNFASALYDGARDVSVNYEPISGGFSVRASGATVLFIEFGAGIHYPDADLSPYRGAENMVHGAYGEKGNDDYWFYTGQPGNAGGELAYGHSNTTITHGNPANMPMYNTVKELEMELESIVREVFA